MLADAHNCVKCPVNVVVSAAFFFFIFSLLQFQSCNMSCKFTEVEVKVAKMHQYNQIIVKTPFVARADFLLSNACLLKSKNVQTTGLCCKILTVNFRRHDEVVKKMHLFSGTHGSYMFGHLAPFMATCRVRDP